MTDEEKNKISEAISDALFERLKLSNPSTFDVMDVLKVRLINELMVYLINPVKVYGSLEIVEILRAVADSLELAHKEGLN